MVVVFPAIFGLIAAVAAFIAVTAQFEFDPFYSWLITIHPGARRLDAARSLLVGGGRIRIADNQDELETIHEVACEEYDNISEQWTPVEFRWTANGFYLRYAEQRKEGKKNIRNIKEELLGYFDERIAGCIAQVAAAGWAVAIVGFILVIMTAVT